MRAREAARNAVLEALRKGNKEVHPEAVAALLKEVERRPLAGAATLRFPSGEIWAFWVGGNALIERREPLVPPKEGLLEWFRGLQRHFTALLPLEVEVPTNPRLEAWLRLALEDERRYRARALALAQRLLLDLPPPSKDPRWRGPREILLEALAPAWRSRTHHRPLLLWRPGAGAWTAARPRELLSTPFPFFAAPYRKEMKRDPILPGRSGHLLYASPFPTWKEPPGIVLRPQELFAPYLGEDLAGGVERGDIEALQEAAKVGVLHHLAR